MGFAVRHGGSSDTAWREIEQRVIHHFPWFSDDTSGFLVSDQTLRAPSGNSQAAVPAYLAPCLRNSLAQPWRRLAGRAIVARARRYFHDANLYACGTRATETASCSASSERVMDSHPDAQSRNNSTFTYRARAVMRSITRYLSTALQALATIW